MDGVIGFFSDISIYLRETDIRFPNIGIELGNVPSGFTLFGINIALYGIMIAIGMICGYFLVARIARKSGQDKETYLDFAIYAIVVSVIGARLFYVIFDWDVFKEDFIQVFNIRMGGLAIYGGIIGAIVTGIVYCRIKKYPFFLLADTGIPGLLAGQVIGRWGNFFNREVFGRYTMGIFAMQVGVGDVDSDFSCSVGELARRYSGRTKIYDMIMEVRERIVEAGGVRYIQVHPTFLYESAWNLALLIFILVFWKKRKYDGEVFLVYLAGYGIGRFLIEGIRTDQMFLWKTAIPVFQLVAGVTAVMALAVLVHGRVAVRRGK